MNVAPSACHPPGNVAVEMLTDGECSVSTNLLSAFPAEPSTWQPRQSFPRCLVYVTTSHTTMREELASGRLIDKFPSSFRRNACIR